MEEPRPGAPLHAANAAVQIAVYTLLITGLLGYAISIFGHRAAGSRTGSFGKEDIRAFKTSETAAKKLSQQSTS